MKVKNFVSITRIGVICLTILVALGFSYIPAYAMSNVTRTNVEVAFIVYPDGTVEVFGIGNFTNENPSASSPSIELNAQYSKIADKYNTLLNAKLTLPPDQATSFPFNATTATLNTQCANNITTATLSASIQLCDSFGGMGFNNFPFNSTDLSITGNYADQRFNGTITIHLVPGLTLGDINVDFEGNLTHIILNDSIRVYYNYTMPVEFPELNETSIHWFLEWLNTTIPGTAEGSLYNMTGGRLICTTFNTTLTPIDNNCADVGFFVVIKAAEGDFIQLLSNIYMDILKSVGMGVPYPIDPYPLINGTVYSIKNAGFSMSYSKSSKTVTFNSNLVQNLTELQKIYAVLPSMYPPEIQPYVELLLNTTYVSIYFSTETIAYSNGQITYNGNYTATGDLNAQVNHFKNVYVDMMNATTPGPQWLINTIKNTNINITCLSFSLKMNSTFQQVSFESLKFAPPVNPINATAFKLENFFNTTTAMFGDGQEPPRFNETLKLIVQGRSNETHTVTVHFNPDEVPEPDEFLSENTLVWNNQSISKLKHLVFKIWEGKAESIYNPSSITPSNPYTINAEQVNCKLIINSISQSTIINIKRATAPDVPLPGAYQLLGTCIQISATENVTDINATIRIYYTPEQLSELGLDENSLKIFYFDEASNKWIEMETQVNKDEHYAEATISHLSLWALFGQPSKQLWQELWFIATIAIIAIAVIVVAALFILRRKGKKGEA
ncbi:MAG: hypothetical protein QW270_03350 [Candidatus Bathyarchaeia archaeon]